MDYIIILFAAITVLECLFILKTAKEIFTILQEMKIIQMAENKEATEIKPKQETEPALANTGKRKKRVQK